MDNTKNLLGIWKSSGSSNPAVIIMGDVGNLILVSEEGFVSTGTLENGLLTAASWKGEGKVSKNNQEIIWNNGATWGKPSKVDLDGPWIYEGNRVSIEFDSRSSFFLINERGARARAFLNGQKLSVPMWKLEGVLSTDRKEIKFENNSAWVREE